MNLRDHKDVENISKAKNTKQDIGILRNKRKLRTGFYDQLLLRANIRKNY